MFIIKVGRKFPSIFLVTFVLGLFSCSEGENFDNLVIRENIIYKKFSHTPYTGTVTGLAVGQVKKGLKYGAWVFWHKNGQLWKKGSYIKDKMEGPWIYYSKNGKLNYLGTGTYKNNHRISNKF